MDGAGVICYFVFAIAAMDGVTDAIASRPKVVATFIDSFPATAAEAVPRASPIGCFHSP